MLEDVPSYRRDHSNMSVAVLGIAHRLHYFIRAIDQFSDLRVGSNFLEGDDLGADNGDGFHMCIA